MPDNPPTATTAHRDPGVITQQLDRLDNEMRVLFELIDEVEDRLQPVLGPNYEDGDGTVPAPPNDEGVVANRLMNACQAMDERQRRLIRLRDRIQL